MILLKWIGISVAVIVLLVLGVLLLPIDVVLLADTEHGLRFRFRCLGKLYGERASSENPLVGLFKQAVGLSKHSAEQDAEQHGGKTPFSETVGTLVTMVDRVRWLLRRCRISRLRVNTVSGGEDAAVEYGTICAVVYPLAEQFRRHGRLKTRNTQLSLRCDYEAQSDYDIEVAMRATILHAVYALVPTAVRHILRKKKERNGYGTS